MRRACSACIWKARTSIRASSARSPTSSAPASIDEIRALHALAPIRLITLAPELPGNLDIIVALRAAGFQVQIGHTLGSYEDGVAALERGAGGFTHLFNAMTGMHHREPGIVGAALAHARYAEIIPDLLHVHPGAIRAALRAIPCLFCVTDSTAATGMPDGDYRLGRHRVTKCLGGVRLADGTLAGSTLTMDQALRNLVDHRASASRTHRGACRRTPPNTWGCPTAAGWSRARAPTWWCSTATCSCSG